MVYQTKGVCSKEIQFDIKDGIIKSVQFTAGCQGNLSGLSNLVVGMKATEVIDKIKGIRCGGKATSCPDQLALALEQWMKNQSS